jgi:hypothetical protein
MLTTKGGIETRHYRRSLGILNLHAEVGAA